MSICFSKKKLVRSIWHNWSKKLNLVKTYFFLFLFNCYDLIVKSLFFVWPIHFRVLGQIKFSMFFIRNMSLNTEHLSQHFVLNSIFFRLDQMEDYPVLILFFHFSLFYFKLIYFHSFILFLFFNPTKVYYFLSNMLEIVMEV